MSFKSLNSVSSLESACVVAAHVPQDCGREWHLGAAGPWTDSSWEGIAEAQPTASKHKKERLQG